MSVFSCWSCSTPRSFDGWLRDVRLRLDYISHACAIRQFFCCHCLTRHNWRVSNAMQKVTEAPCSCIRSILCVRLHASAEIWSYCSANICQQWIAYLSSVGMWICPTDAASVVAIVSFRKQWRQNTCVLSTSDVITTLQVRWRVSPRTGCKQFDAVCY